MNGLENITQGHTVLVTGATGFIGGRLVARLLEGNQRVRVLARDPSGAQRLGAVEIHQGDLLSPESLEGIEREIGVVVHCASLLGKWGTSEELLTAVNVEGSLQLARRFERSAGLRRFLYLSAGGVTGPVPSKAVDESYACQPATPYERTKLAAERGLLELAATGSLPLTVVRPTFTYGPGDPHKLALFRTVQRGRYAFIGDGESVNHPAYVDDVIRGILLAIAKGTVGEIYIIGGERPVSKRELVYTIADVLETPRPRWHIPRFAAQALAPLAEVLGRLSGIDPMLTRSRVMMMADNFGYSIDKACQDLGYRPQIGLREGIELTVAGYRRLGWL